MYITTPQIFAVTETWLTNSILNNEILPSGYTIFRCDRNSRGGGVMLCVDEQLPCKLVSVFSDIETIVITICGNPAITICLSYNPPGASAETLDALFSTIGDVADVGNVIILGDFNCPDINWASLSATAPYSLKFCDLIFDKNLSQLVSSPTHVKGNILDLVITNCEDRLGRVMVDEANECSDYFIIRFVINSFASHPSKCSKFSVVPDFSKADYDSMFSFFLDHDFSNFYESKNIDELWLYLKLLLSEAIDLLVPSVRVSNYHTPKWFTPNIRHSINKLRHRRRKFSKRPSVSAQDAIIREENRIKACIENARADWERKLVEDFASSNNYKIYSHIRSLSRHTSFPNPMTLGSDVAMCPETKAELFNRFFHSVLSLSAVNSLHPTTITTGPLSSLQINPLDTLEALESLDGSKAMGVDGISPKVLKRCALAIYEPVTHLFQLSLDQGLLPQEWKIHLVTPVFKSGDRSLVENYRPISLLCILSKVLERLIFDNLIDHMSKILNPYQFGFLRGKSTIQNLLIFYGDIMNAVGRRYQVDAIYLDFRKAFDSVPHAQLLIKLESYGITGNLWSWFRNYLTNRQQTTSVDGHRSNYLPVTSGVPQGSILGPLLFIIFLNDLPSVITSSRILKYADDTKCYKTITNPNDAVLLQSDLDNVGNWSVSNEISFNLSKLASVHINCRCPNSVGSIYSMCYVNIISQPTQRDLGIKVSEDLSWTSHHTSIMSKAYSKMGMIRCAFSCFCPVSTKLKLYISLIRSQLLYGSQLWRPMLIKDIQKLERVQRRATKFILVDASSNYKSRLLTLGLLPLMMVYELNDIMFFINNLKSRTRSFDILQFVSFSSSKTRSGSVKLVYKRSLINAEKNFYFSRLVKLWIALPVLDLTVSPLTLRAKLKKLLWAVFVDKFDPTIPCTYHFICPCSTHPFQPQHFRINIHFNTITYCSSVFNFFRQPD